MTQKFILQRRAHDDKSTWGVLSQELPNGELMRLCCILEDAPHPTKIPGETRIPAGAYKMILRTFGGFHERYSLKFSNKPKIMTLPWHRGMVWLTGVPNYDGILVHIGNSHKDTRGCLLVCTSVDAPDRSPDGHYYGKDSTRAYEQVYPVLRDAIGRGETTIEIRDEG